MHIILSGVEHPGPTRSAETPAATIVATASVTQRSSPPVKTALFRKLFRGREDIYPRRFQNRKTGRIDRFRLNPELSIPFNGNGHIEVDFLCPEARLVIELDGAQHLSNPEAYRRDRRKDALLQRNGYFVLRFLAEDVGKHFDRVLDSILETLVNREKLGT